MTSLFNVLFTLRDNIFINWFKIWKLQKNIIALKILNKREYEIICRRFGLDGYSSETQREIAKSMGISRSYVSRIEKRVLTKLYLHLKEDE